MLRTVKDTYEVLFRDSRSNESQIRQLSLDYRLFRTGQHPRCSRTTTREQASSASARRASARRGVKRMVVSHATEVLPEDVVSSSIVSVQDVKPIVTDDPTHFHAVDFATGVPEFVLSGSASFYRALHRDDSTSFPLSRFTFKNRDALREYGLNAVHGGDTTRWRFNRVQAVSYGRNSTTNQRYVCALIINERHEPRFGYFFCPNPDYPDIDVQPVPCFLKNLRDTRLAYCGTWAFERLTDLPEGIQYVLNSRPRSIVYRMSLVAYERQWEGDGD